MRRGRNDDRVLALLLIALTLAPLADAQASHLAIEPVGATSAQLDTAHLVHRFRFRVTNTGDALDYVTIPRGEIRWTDTRETVLGFPSPEFGLPLAPGESGEMWASLDVGAPTLGAREAVVPFRSERTGETTTRAVTLSVAPAPPASTRLVVRVDAPDARVEITDLTTTTLPDVRTAAGPGATTAEVPPGLYAVRADAPGRQGATRIVRVPGDPTEIALALGPARASAEASGLTRASLDESSWTLAGSDDLSVLVSMPMVHQQPSSPGRGVGLVDGARAWDVEFPGPQGSRPDAGPFQALDTTAAVSPDGSRAALFDWNGVLRVVEAEDGRARWSSTGGEERHPLYPPASKFGEGFFTSGAAAFSADGARLAAGGSNGRLVLFDAAEGRALWSRAFGAEIRALRFTKQGGLLVGSGDWALHMLDAGTGETRWSADEPEFWPFFFLAESADGARVATGGKDSVYRVWDATDGTLVSEHTAGFAFVTGGAVGPWGGAFSDWGYGVRAFDADGDITWFRRYPQAVAATTDDGRFTLVAWFRPDAGTAGLALLDDTGTTIWEAPADVAAPCTSTASPFPPKQWKTVLLARPANDALRFAVACIGGGVVTGTLTIRALEDPRPSPSPSPTPSPETGPQPGPGPGTTPVPLAGALALVALALALALRRR